MGHVLSVNVGTPVTASWAGNKGRTSMRKHSVTGPVAVRELGLDGDQVADRVHHGGVFQAVYAFAQEDLDGWAALLGGPIGPGMFGENLTTVGIDVNQAVLGEHWRVGTALLSPIEVRVPCSVFTAWLGLHHLDNAVWAKRFTDEGRPGPYLRVLDEGILQSGDEIVVEHRPAHAFTVSMMFRALMTEPDLLPGLLEVPGLPEPVYEVARRRVADRRGPTLR